MIVVVVVLSPNMLNFGGCRRWNRGGETDLPIITIQSNCFFFLLGFSNHLVYTHTFILLLLLFLVAFQFHKFLKNKQITNMVFFFFYILLLNRELKKTQF